MKQSQNFQILVTKDKKLSRAQSESHIKDAYIAQRLYSYKPAKTGISGYQPVKDMKTSENLSPISGISTLGSAFDATRWF